MIWNEANHRQGRILQAFQNFPLALGGSMILQTKFFDEVKEHFSKINTKDMRGVASLFYL